MKNLVLHVALIVPWRRPSGSSHNQIVALGLLYS